ncbi:uncharacterized protein PF3D7_1120600-like [Leguminivora glycinivorella]|uniref:uncharacterized protein PF3D7_1120600-like n=1 Tax=Leguminivora glycinivorella TaxID=1035111 RepID=UPI002010325A|nr:uncharacterized protein PF3D7_1120600-like [Leguminivora glycinivorella]
MKFGNKKDQPPGVDVIDKVQTALEKIKEGIELRNGRRSNTHDMTFTDFVAQAAKILKKYNDNDLEDAFVVFGDETRRYINKNSELHDLLGSGSMRRRVSEHLDNMREMEAEKLREHLEAIISAVENKKYNGEKNDLLDIGDFVYIGGHDKLRSVIRDLEKLSRSTDVRLEDVLKRTLRSLIFDHFNKLNDNIKRELIEMAKDYWRVYGNKKWNKRTRTTTSSTMEVDEDKEEKHPYRNSLSFKAQKEHEMRGVRPILRTRKPHNATQHVNKRYKYRDIIKKDRKAVTAFTKLHKYRDTTRITLSDEKKSASVELESDHKTEEIVEDKKLTKPHNFDVFLDKKHLKNTMKGSKFTPSFAESKRPKHSIENDEKLVDTPNNDLMLLTGGQKAQKVDLRGDTPGDVYNEYEKSEEAKEDQQVSKESVTDSTRPTAVYISVERFVTKRKKQMRTAKEYKNDESNVTDLVARTSGEGLSTGDLENISEVETDRKNLELSKYRELEKNRTLDDNNSELEYYPKQTMDSEFNNDPKIERKHMVENIKNYTLNIKNSEYVNDREPKQDPKMNGLIKETIKNDTIKMENLEIESELENYHNNKNVSNLQNQDIRKYNLNDTLQMALSDSSETDSDIENEPKLINDYTTEKKLNVNDVKYENPKNNNLDNDNRIARNSEPISKDVRKYIVNDTLPIDLPESRTYVKNMIHNLEKQIEDVKEQVDYVKNLTYIDDITPEQTLTINGKKVSFRSSSKSKTKAHIKNSESIERDNREYFSRENSDIESSIEINKTLEFRTNDINKITTESKTTEPKTTQPQITVQTTTDISNSDKESKINYLIRKLRESATARSVHEDSHEIFHDGHNEFNARKSEDPTIGRKSLNVEIKNGTSSTINMKLNEIDTTTENTTVVRIKREYYL